MEKRRIAVTHEDLPNIPTLVTFKIGDLLRCKCSSKELEAMSLFSELERISHFHPETLRIVRVKNRLRRGTKDILVNLVYRNVLLVEMQIAVNSSKSNFLDCSDKFNHYIYELQRSKFGPLTELCNIWMQCDMRADFYQKSAKQLNDRLQKGHHCKGEQAELTLPFKCDSCHQYYSTLAKKHVLCKKCQQRICILCKVRGVEDYESMRGLFPQLPSVKGHQLLKPSRFSEEEIPECGLALDPMSTMEKVKVFKKVRVKEEWMLFAKRRETKYEVIASIKDGKSAKGFLKSHILVVNEELGGVIEEDRLQEYYFMPKLLKEVHLKQKESLIINGKDLTTSTLQAAIDRHDYFPEVKKLNLNDNSIDDIRQVAQLFPRIQTLLLSILALI